MRFEALLVVMLFAAGAFAGCLRGAEEDVVETATTEETNVAAPEGRGTIVAFEETNRTEDGFEGVDHHHDMWMGATRLVIFETDAMMGPGVGTSGARATFRPPQGTFVPEGTATIEFTISNPTRHVCEPLVTFGGRFYCTDYLGGLPAAPPVPDPAPPQGLKLRYKHASTAEWIDAGEIVWGGPTLIKIMQAIETDMPHATSSVWEFQVESPNSNDNTLSFHAKAEAVRGEGVIPLWPGHPLFYDEDTPFRVVVDNALAKACDSGLSNTGCLLAGEGVEPVVPSKLVSYGTRTLHVYANITRADFPNPATKPSVWFLYHRNATGQNNITNIFDEQTHGIETLQHYWVLPVDDGSMDSPYADGSRWEFEIGAAFTPPAGSSCYGGCADWSAEYTLTVIATAEQLAPEAYHMYCLDPDAYCGE